MNTGIDKDLILGIGNVDRQDDGVAWHILSNLNHHLGRISPTSPDDDFGNIGKSPDLRYVLQLTPDLAEDLSSYQRVCFVDAHTGVVPEDVHVSKVNTAYQYSPFTHHLTPASLLALTLTIYQHAPEAIIVSVRGYQFEFCQNLSVKTAQNAIKAADLIWKWLGMNSADDSRSNL